MVKVTNAFTTYGIGGAQMSNREDLSNAIYNIDPFDTPLMSAIRRRNVKNRTFDWQTEFLPTVNTANAQLEGFLLTNAAAQPAIRRSNVTQISERDATVSGSQEESDAAGKGSGNGAPDGDGQQGAEVGHGDGAVLAPGVHRRRRHHPDRPPDRRLRPLGCARDRPFGRCSDHRPSRRRDGWRLRRPADHRHGRIHRGRWRIASVADRGDARQRDAEGLHQRRPVRRCGSCRLARSGQSRPLSAGPPPRCWSARPKSCRRST